MKKLLNVFRFSPELLANVTLIFICSIPHNTYAGGFEVNPEDCPKYGWYPYDRVNPEVIKVVCRYLLAVDRADYREAYGLFADRLRRQITAMDFEAKNIEARDSIYGGHGSKLRSTAERFVLAQEPESRPDGRSKIYHFVFRASYRDGEFLEEIYVDEASREIVAFWIKPI